MTVLSLRCCTAGCSSEFCYIIESNVTPEVSWRRKSEEAALILLEKMDIYNYNTLSLRRELFAPPS